MRHTAQKHVFPLRICNNHCKHHLHVHNQRAAARWDLLCRRIFQNASHVSMQLNYSTLAYAQARSVRVLLLGLFDCERKHKSLRPASCLPFFVRRMGNDAVEHYRNDTFHAAPCADAYAEPLLYAPNTILRHRLHRNAHVGKLRIMRFVHLHLRRTL